MQNYMGMCIGGPLAGYAIDHASKQYRIPIVKTSEYYGRGSSSKDVVYFEYKHLDEDGIAVWVPLDKDIQWVKAELILNYSSYAVPEDIHGDSSASQN